MIAASFLVCLFLTGVFSSPTIHPDYENPRIVGGTRATLGQFKWAVSLQYRGHTGSHFCGGSILSKRYVLTAAHCIYWINERRIQIQYGVIDNKSRKNVLFVSEVIIHERYQEYPNYPNDIAVLKLERDMDLDGVNSGPVSLPDAPLEFVNQTEVQVCGWGYRSIAEARVQDNLLWTHMPMWSSDICLRYVHDFDPKYHVCAGTLDGQHKQCSGDSGGPMTQNETQYGIVSWSIKPCRIINKPAVFTNLANYRDWIRNKTGV